MGVRHILVANILAGVVMVILLMPGVLDTLGSAGTSVQSAELKNLIDYNSALTEENQTLRDGIGKAICSPDGTYDVPPSNETPHTQDDIDERLQREGAEAGAIEVSLAWDGPADLDLSVTCPGGVTIGDTIMFNNKRACGGEHDVDMNAGSNNSDRPVEHITWPEGAAPPGEYKVNVNYYLAHDAPSTIPYTVEIKIGDAVKRLSKTAECCGTLAFVDSFVIGAPGTGGDTTAEDPGGTPGTDTSEPPSLPKDPNNTVIKRDGADVPLTDAIEKGVVLVVTRRPDSAGIGSGFVISDRRVVTNRHVVEGATEIYIISQALGELLPVRVIAQTPNSVEGQIDFAVLETETPLTSIAPLAVTPVTNRLEQVVSAGFPGFIVEMEEGGYRLLHDRSLDDFRALVQRNPGAIPEVVTTEGIITRPVGDTSAAPYLMHSADIAQGNSGGPLMDLCGRVLGINTLVNPAGAMNYHTSWAIGAAGLLSFLESNNIAVSTDSAECNPGTVAHEDQAPPPNPGGG